jgi:hypothetical protein
MLIMHKKDVCVKTLTKIDPNVGVKKIFFLRTLRILRKT